MLASSLGLPLAWFSTFQNPGTALLLFRLLWAGCTGVLAYWSFATGRVSRWRSVFFIVLACAFIVEFKANLIGLTGSAFITPAQQEVPYCHIAIVSSFFNQLYQQYLAFMSGSWQQWSVLGWGALVWIAVTLVLGQAWCSWACFYGGLDTGFSRILKRPMIRWTRVPGIVRDFPAAVLVAALLLSLVCAKPVFCLWGCPLKLGTGFLDPVPYIHRIQLVVFALVGIVFLIALPLLTKKRTFCSLICPFGAWQAFFGKVNPYRVTIQEDRCTHCLTCVRICPSFAIDAIKRVSTTERPESACLQVPSGNSSFVSSPSFRRGDERGEETGVPIINAYCTRCGECMDACPAGAIDYTVGWTRPAESMRTLARPLFLLSAWLVAGSVSLCFVPAAMLRLWHWIEQYVCALVS